MRSNTSRFLLYQHNNSCRSSTKQRAWAALKQNTRMLWLLLTVCLTLATQPANAQDVDSDETDGHSSRKILGSSVVTSVSVVMETNNGKHTYYADAVGQPLSKPNIASQVASPINLLNPDRYEFYTFNDDGELVKRLMTLKEIQGIIAGGDSESAGYNSGYNAQMPNPDNDVTNVVENVQNVLKEEIEAHKNPVEGKPIFDTPDVSANWNLILPAIFGDTMMSDAVTIDDTHQPPNIDGNSDDSSTEYMKLSSRTPDAGEQNEFEQNLLSKSSTQMDSTTEHLLQENTQSFVTEPKIQVQNSMPSTSLFSTWFGSTSTKSVPTPEAKPVLTSTESVMAPVSEEIISSTSVKNVEQQVTNEPISVTEKVSVNNVTFDENKQTSQQFTSTGPFTDGTTLGSTTISPLNRTPQNEDKITTMALISEKTNTPVPVTEISKSASSLPQTTTETIEFPKITELISMLTRPTTKEAVKTTPSTTTVRTSVTFPHSSQFTHSSELRPSSTEKPLTNDTEKSDNPSLANNEAIHYNDHHNLNINSGISTENIAIAPSAVTETAAILNSVESEIVNLGQNTVYQPSDLNMNENIFNYSTSTEYGIVADIDQLIANISEEMITKNENIPVENYNVSEIIQQILNYPTNASDIINQTITLASLIVDSNREQATTENVLNEHTASSLQSTTMDDTETIAEKQASAIPVLLSSTTAQATVSTTEVTTPQAYETVSTTETLRTTPETVKTTMDNSKSTTDISQSTTELLKTIPGVVASSLSTSTPTPTDVTTKLTTQNIPKTPSQTPTTVNDPTVQPNTTKMETVQTTTLSSTTLEHSESTPSTKLEVTEKEMVTNKMTELSNKPEVLEDKSTTQIPTSVVSYITNNMNDQTSESTTVTSTTSVLSTTVLNTDNIKTETAVTKDDKTTEQPKIDSTLITRMPTTNMVTQTSTEFVQPSTISPTTSPKTESPVPVTTTTVPSVTKVTGLNTSTTRRKIIAPSTTTTGKPVTTNVKTITTTGKPITTSSKPATSNSIPVTTTSIPVTTTAKPVTTSVKSIVTSGKPVTTTSKPITTTKMTNKTTNDISNISEPYRRTEDMLPGKTPGDTWKLVQTVQPPQISANKKHNTTTHTRHTTEKPTLEPYQPTITLDMSAQGTFGMPVLSEDMTMFSKMYNELALKFWNALSVKDISSDRSATVSPFGAISMLAMIFLGARGSTSGEMNDVLKLDDIVTFNPHLVFKEVTESVVARKSLSAIVRELYTDGNKGRVHDFYKERVRQFYDGHVEEVDFKRINNVIRRRTNALINKQTRGQMPQYLEETTLTLKAPLSALSTNIFQADCSKASTEGRDGELYFIVLPTMRQRRLVPIPAAVWRSGFIAGYDPELDATAVSLGTMNQDISTVFVIPGQQGHSAPGDVLLRLEARLLNTTYAPETWTQLLKSMLPRPGLEIQIPRFLHKSVINTSDALKRMGLNLMFRAGKANLQGINGISHSLYFSDMVQVNEFSICGDSPQVHTETYPSTVEHLENHNDQMRNFKYVDYSEVEYDIASIPLPLRPRQARLPDIPRLRFDRPFLYFVRHNPTGLILHLGRFNPRLVT